MVLKVKFKTICTLRQRFDVFYLNYIDGGLSVPQNVALSVELYDHPHMPFNNLSAHQISDLLLIFKDVELKALSIQLYAATALNTSQAKAWYEGLSQLPKNCSIYFDFFGFNLKQFFQLNHFFYFDQFITQSYHIASVNFRNLRADVNLKQQAYLFWSSLLQNSAVKQLYLENLNLNRFTLRGIKGMVQAFNEAQQPIHVELQFCRSSQKLKAFSECNGLSSLNLSHDIFFFHSSLVKRLLRNNMVNMITLQNEDNYYDIEDFHHINECFHLLKHVRHLSLNHFFAPNQQSIWGRYLQDNLVNSNLASPFSQLKQLTKLTLIDNLVASFVIKKKPLLAKATYLSIAALPNLQILDICEDELFWLYHGAGRLFAKAFNTQKAPLLLSIISYRVIPKPVKALLYQNRAYYLCHLSSIYGYLHYIKHLPLDLISEHVMCYFNIPPEIPDFIIDTVMNAASNFPKYQILYARACEFNLFMNSEFRKAARMRQQKTWQGTFQLYSNDILSTARNLCRKRKSLCAPTAPKNLAKSTHGSSLASARSSSSVNYD